MCQVLSTNTGEEAVIEPQGTKAKWIQGGLAILIVIILLFLTVAPTARASGYYSSHGLEPLFGSSAASSQSDQSGFIIRHYGIQQPPKGDIE